MTKYLILTVLLITMTAFSQPASLPPIEPGIPLELAKWRAAHYSDVRYKLNLTLEKMSPVLRGTIEIRVNVSEPPASAGGQSADSQTPPIILDWRRIRGHEDKSTISNVTINGRSAVRSSSFSWPPVDTQEPQGNGGPPKGGTPNFAEHNEHLVFRDGVVAGENVIKLDFTSPILTSGSAITRYVDKEDGSEYIYSLFVPSDASTAFPVFDQPDLKARFELTGLFPDSWTIVSNSSGGRYGTTDCPTVIANQPDCLQTFKFEETKPISTYVFAFAAGPFEKVTVGNLSGSEGVSSSANKNTLPTGRVSASDSETVTKEELKRTYKKWLENDCCGIMTKEETKAFNEEHQDPLQTHIYVRRSQAEKFKPHAAEVFRLNREAIKYFEEYFDYKFPFPKYDLVLIPEFPFGGMEHAGATFLRESAIIFPQEPTKNDHISRALLIFHEASHQWFGDTVTMRWFDDLWLKEGFATFTAYKAMERIMPEMMAWKVFYERVKQAAYQTDSTKGTTPIYQEIPNLSAAKSAYGNIVYNKAPAFLRQAEFYLGEDKFQTAVRAFLKKHEFRNAGWEDLVREFEGASRLNLKEFSHAWVMEPGLFRIRFAIASTEHESRLFLVYPSAKPSQSALSERPMKLRVSILYSDGTQELKDSQIKPNKNIILNKPPHIVFPNYRDYGYGIFLLDEKSREYVLKNIQNEKDPFLRSMMWGALWDSVREGELDPSVFIETAIRNLPAEQDETMSASIASRVGTALNYYVSDKTREELAPRIENVFSDKMRTAPTLGQRITFYRAFLNAASSENARSMLKAMLKGGNPSSSEGAPPPSSMSRGTLPTGRVSASAAVPDIPLKTKDKFDIITRLLILGDPDAPKLLAELEKTETSDDAKRYAYAARAGVATAENKAKYWKDFTENKEISESWIEAAFGPWNSIRHSELTLPYLQKALQELPNHKRNRKIFFVNGWLGAFIGGQRSEEALATINKFLADNPSLDRDLRLKILENADLIERAVNIRSKYPR